MTQLRTQNSEPRIQNELSLVVQWPDGEEVKHSLVEREITIGRDPENGICIPHAFVSQFHAKIVRHGGALTLVDLGSVNKTRVNGRPVLQKSLTPGDEIEFAGVKSRLVQMSSPEPRVKKQSLEVWASSTIDSEPAILKKADSRATLPKLPLFLAVFLFVLLAAYLAAKVF